MAWIARLIGRKIIGQEWEERAERIDSRAYTLAEEAAEERRRKKQMRQRDVLAGFDDMLESRHQSLYSLVTSPEGDSPESNA
ncbi:hypothetical protein F0Q45_21780 [Mycobacterium simiae]|uniref:Uncharacterized protein n=1 Tax=Mycobacterium simiae TaxID=1784 RepID=A0A5B1BHW9_MYCSI|nr:hypothetical protein [Mycobacterium simiae]KAA1248228.1 hypothetical protein F0Q45_21780 [Mycobacterium simiae]